MHHFVMLPRISKATNEKDQHSKPQFQAVKTAKQDLKMSGIYNQTEAKKSNRINKQSGTPTSLNRLTKINEVQTSNNNDGWKTLQKLRKALQHQKQVNQPSMTFADAVLAKKHISGTKPHKCTEKVPSVKEIVEQLRLRDSYHQLRRDLLKHKSQTNVNRFRRVKGLMAKNVKNISFEILRNEFQVSSIVKKLDYDLPINNNEFEMLSEWFQHSLTRNSHILYTRYTSLWTDNHKRDFIKGFKFRSYEKNDIIVFQNQLSEEYLTIIRGSVSVYINPRLSNQRENVARFHTKGFKIDRFDNGCSFNEKALLSLQKLRTYQTMNDVDNSTADGFDSDRENRSSSSATSTSPSSSSNKKDKNKYDQKYIDGFRSEATYVAEGPVDILIIDRRCFEKIDKKFQGYSNSIAKSYLQTFYPFNEESADVIDELNIFFKAITIPAHTCIQQQYVHDDSKLMSIATKTGNESNTDREIYFLIQGKCHETRKDHVEIKKRNYNMSKKLNTTKIATLKNKNEKTKTTVNKKKLADVDIPISTFETGIIAGSCKIIGNDKPLTTIVTSEECQVLVIYEEKLTWILNQNRTLKRKIKQMIRERKTFIKTRAQECVQSQTKLAKKNPIASNTILKHKSLKTGDIFNSQSSTNIAKSGTNEQAQETIDTVQLQKKLLKLYASFEDRDRFLVKLEKEDFEINFNEAEVVKKSQQINENMQLQSVDAIPKKELPLMKTLVDKKTYDKIVNFHEMYSSNGVQKIDEKRMSQMARQSIQLLEPEKFATSMFFFVPFCWHVLFFCFFKNNFVCVFRGLYLVFSNVTVFEIQSNS